MYLNSYSSDGDIVWGQKHADDKGKWEVKVVEKGWIDRAWKFYKMILTFPSDATGFERKAGVLLYFASLLVAVGAVYLMYTEPEQFYTEAKLEFFPEYSNYTTPDIIICPKKSTLRKGFVFDVKYNYRTLDQWNISRNTVNELTRLKFESCEKEGPCPELTIPCFGEMLEACKLLNASFLQVVEENKRLPRAIHSLTDRIETHVFNIWQRHDKQWTLEMLWMMVIDPSFLGYTLGNRTSRIRIEPINCMMLSYYETTDVYDQKCRDSIQPIWVGLTYCTFIPSQLKDYSGEFEHLELASSYDLFDFWLERVGSFLTSGEVPGNSEISTENTVAAKEIEYSLIEYTDTTITSRRCHNRQLLRGIRINCSANPQQVIKFYDWTIKEQFQDPVYFGRNGRQLISKHKSLTNYTRFQLAVGLISCCVGHSVMQLIYFVFQKGRRFQLVKEWETLLVWVSLFVLISGTLLMGYIDLKFYFNERFNVLFKEKEVTLGIPSISIYEYGRRSSGSFNVTKFREHNVSLEFYNYLKLMAFKTAPLGPGIYRTFESQDSNGTASLFVEFPEWFVKNLRTGVSQINTCNHGLTCQDTTNQFRGFMLAHKDDSNLIDPSLNSMMSQDIRNEAKRLSKILGHSTEMNINQLASYFHLNISKILTHCSIGKIKFDCGKHAAYTALLSLKLTVPEAILVNEKNVKTMVGIHEALEVHFDIHEWSAHSDIISYFGPGLDDFTEEIKDAVNCSVEVNGWYKYSCPDQNTVIVNVEPPESYSEGISVGISSNGYASASHELELSVNFEDVLRQRPENHCIKDDERQCTHSLVQLLSIFYSVQIDSWCKCVYCSLRNGSQYYSDLKKILGKPINCCTTSILTTCYSTYVKRANVSNGAYVRDHNWMVLSRIADGYQPSPNTSLYASIDKETFAKYLLGFENFHPSIQERLIDVTRECTAISCNKIRYKLTNHYEKKSNDGLVKIKAFFASSDAEEEDRFVLSEFVAVLLCSYSFTFGVGLIGILEIVGASFKFLKPGRLNSPSLLRDHLMRSMGVWANTQESDKPEFLVKQPKIKLQPRRRIRVNIIHVGQSSDRSNNMTNQENRAEDPGTDMGARTSSAVQPVDQEDKNNIRSWAMVTMLLIAFILMIATIVNFFSSSNNLNYTVDIESEPLIRPPSVVLCVTTVEEAKNLLNTLRNSQCKTYGSKSTKICSEVFQTYLRNDADRFCYIYDNTRVDRRALDTENNDLVLKAPNSMDKVSLYIHGIAQISLREIAPLTKWRNSSMKILYNVRIKRSQVECDSDSNLEKLGQCGVDFLLEDPTYLCYIGPREIQPPLKLSGDCARQEFTSSVVYYEKVKEGENLRNYLVIKAGIDFAVVTLVKPKYNILDLASIVGGYIGSFVELTLLHLFSILLFAVMAIAIRIKQIIFCCFMLHASVR